MPISGIECFTTIPCICWGLAAKFPALRRRNMVGNQALTPHLHLFAVRIAQNERRESLQRRSDFEKITPAPHREGRGKLWHAHSHDGRCGVLFAGARLLRKPPGSRSSSGGCAGGILCCIHWLAYCQALRKAFTS